MTTWRPTTGEPREPRRLRSSLDRYARMLGLSDAGPLEVVFARWDEVVGEAVAAHARPVSLTRGALVVAVDEPAWATQLRYLERSVLDRLAAAAGAPVAERIDVRVRPGR